jgi:hypothetical protein
MSNQSIYGKEPINACSKSRWSLDRLALIFVAFLVVSATNSFAQTFPSFSAPVIPNSSIVVDSGMSSASVPNGLLGTALMSVYSSNGVLSYNLSTDGVTSAANFQVPIAGATLACSSNEPGDCAATIRVFQNTIYVAFPSANGASLTVMTATPIPGAANYNWAIVHTDTSVNLEAAPEMEVVNGLLVIVFPTFLDPPFQNAFYTVTFDGTTWQPANDTFLGGSSLGVSSFSKPAMAVLNNTGTPTLFMCTQQNGGLDDHHLFIYNTTDGIHWNFVEEDAQLSIGGNASMVNFNGTLVLANQQNSPNHLFIFVSPDGSTWTAQEYTNILIGAGPAIALFNGGLGLSFKSANSTNFFNGFATN